MLNTVNSATTVLSNATIFDAKGTAPFEGDVIVRDGLIAEILSAGSAGRPADAGTIDCTGQWLTPGLIDAHAHACAIDYHFGEQDRHYAPAVAAFLIAKRLKRMLDLGFTTVRDAGGTEWGFKEAIQQGLIPGPKLLISGQVLSQTGGHGDHRTRYETGQENTGNSSSHVIADGVDQVRHAVRDQLRRGADQIKVMASGGAVSPTDVLDSTQYSLDELKVAVQEAEAVGTYVMAHALSAKAIRVCLEAGIRTIEHGNFLDEDTAELMVEHGAYLVPTAIVYENAAARRDEIGFSPAVGEKLAKAAARCREVIAMAHRKGVKVGFGTDLLSKYVDMMGAGLLIHAEVVGGEAALLSATSVNAELCRVLDRVGTIEVGKAADLLLFNDSPIANPSVLADESALTLVMKDGSIHKHIR